MKRHTVDPLERLLEPDRVHYDNGVLLDESDFSDEQTYHRGRLARTLAYLHGSGTVAGLEVVPHEDDDSTLVVKAGMAVDRLGRLVEVKRDYCIGLQTWFSEQWQSELSRDRLRDAYTPASGDIPDGAVVDVFLQFKACDRGKTPNIGSGNRDATDSFTSARVRDGFQFNLMIRDDDDEGGIGVPTDNFPTLPGTIATRRTAAANYKMRDAWREGTLFRAIDGKLLPDSEHHKTYQQGIEILLARTTVPLIQDGDLLSYNPAVPVYIDNYIRRFVYSTAEIIWLTNRI